LTLGVDANAVAQGIPISVPFWVFAASNVAIIAALLWWRSPRRSAESLPAERLCSAVRTGARHAANNPDSRATLVRVLVFFPFAIAYLALLPLLARAQMAEGRELSTLAPLRHFGLVRLSRLGHDVPWTKA
jgi:Transmembrane secretion effector